MSKETELIKEIDEHIETAGGLYGLELPDSDLKIIRAALAEKENRAVIEMVKLDDGNFVPKEICTFTNPLTSGGKSYIDDVDLPCYSECQEIRCQDCIIQRVFNKYAALVGGDENYANQD